MEKVLSGVRRRRPGEASWKSELASEEERRSDGGLRRRRRCEDTSRREGGEEVEACSGREDHNALGRHRNHNRPRQG